METSEQTIQQIERAIRKVAEKFPEQQEATIMTDLHLRVTQESGELVTFDDDDNEINRAVIDQWIDNKDEDFYESVTTILRNILHTDLHDMVEKMSILRPFSFVLENDDHEHIAELYCADGDTVILSGDLMPGLDKELDDFLNNLIKE
ncbi:MAG: hypothetical protein II429_03035 [Prevotella sp.]|jgi:hypothetical protein|nr:hypothetical protein [Prevotella sp.]MBQ2192429.1 hypothetical protein [Prevotella sp.]